MDVYIEQLRLRRITGESFVQRRDLDFFFIQVVYFYYSIDIFFSFFRQEAVLWL